MLPTSKFIYKYKQTSLLFIHFIVFNNNDSTSKRYNNNYQNNNTNYINSIPNNNNNNNNNPFYRFDFVRNMSSISSLSKSNESNSLSPIYDKIFNKLTMKFNPIHLQVINESNQHSVPKGNIYMYHLLLFINIIISLYMSLTL